MKRGLAVMRLQPYHYGHFQFIAEMMSQFDEVWIGIGSAQYSRTHRNPFTWEERRNMLLNHIHDHRVRVFPVMDIHSPAHWARHVESEANKYGCGRPFTACAGSEVDVVLFKLAGFDTMVIQRDERQWKPATVLREYLEMGAFGMLAGNIPKENLEWIARFYATTRPLQED